MGDNLISLGYSIVYKTPKPLPRIYSGKLYAFIMKMLEKNPINRPCVRDLLKEFKDNKDFFGKFPFYSQI